MTNSESICADITRAHARTFAAASRFLPAEKRRASFAVYAFCRVADDIVDEHGSGRPADAEVALSRHRSLLDRVVAGTAVDDEPVFQELSWAMRRFDIPASPFYELLDAVAHDLAPAEFETWSELARYCGGVASTVGEMCAHVFGVQAGSAAMALKHARTLGVALQLTNILRDVGEDAALGRCYLPADDLRQFDIQRDEVLRLTIQASDPRWQAMMRHEIARARSLYESAAPGLNLIDRDARCCATICSRGYAAILSAIERRGYDSLGGRARVGAGRKSAIALSAWVGSWTPGERLRASPMHGEA